MTHAYFAAFVTLPTVIEQPGKYITRGGEVVSVTVASARHDFGCRGVYSTGENEGWNKSGRLFAGCDSMNDIVRPA